MKLRTLAISASALGFAAAALNAEIVVTDDLSLTGYLDMYAAGMDYDGDSSETAVAEFELGFNYTTEPYFATVELSYDGSSVGFETAIVGWNVSENLVVSAGNILSYLGWETYDATGLYQFSYAYRGFSPLYPAYAVGAAVDYATDDFSLGVWIGDSSDHDVSYEVAGKYFGIEGLTLFGAWADDPAYETINFWASYEVGGFTFALEYIDVDNTDDFDDEGYLAMVNYAFEDMAITFRYSVEETDTGMATVEIPDWKLFTISPSYTFSDNLLGLVEVSFIDDGGDADYAWAVEFLYTF